MSRRVVKGTRIADMPVILRPGRSGGAFIDESLHQEDSIRYGTDEVGMLQGSIVVDVGPVPEVVGAAARSLHPSDAQGPAPCHWKRTWAK